MPMVALATAILNLKLFVFDNVFHLVRKNWQQSLTYLPAAFAVVAVDLVLIPMRGGVGAALGFLVGATIGLLTSVLATHRYIAVAPPWAWPLAHLRRRAPVGHGQRA